jgi:hypothetical protein
MTALGGGFPDFSREEHHHHGNGNNCKTPRSLELSLTACNTFSQRASSTYLSLRSLINHAYEPNSLSMKKNKNPMKNRNLMTQICVVMHAFSTRQIAAFVNFGVVNASILMQRNAKLDRWPPSVWLQTQNLVCIQT